MSLPICPSGCQLVLVSSLPSPSLFSSHPPPYQVHHSKAHLSLPSLEVFSGGTKNSLQNLSSVQPALSILLLLPSCPCVPVSCFGHTACPPSLARTALRPLSMLFPRLPMSSSVSACQVFTALTLLSFPPQLSGSSVSSKFG